MDCYSEKEFIKSVFRDMTLDSYQSKFVRRLMEQCTFNRNLVWDDKTRTFRHRFSSIQQKPSEVIVKWNNISIPRQSGKRIITYIMDECISTRDETDIFIDNQKDLLYHIWGPINIKLKTKEKFDPFVSGQPLFQTRKGWE